MRSWEVCGAVQQSVEPKYGGAFGWSRSSKRGWENGVASFLNVVQLVGKAVLNVF